MYNSNTNDNKLIKIIDEILNDFKDFEQPYVNNDGDIIIRKKKVTMIKQNNSSILTNIFREIIKNDLKKNRV